MTERSYIGNARLIDGLGQAVPAEPYALLIEGRMIAAVAPQRELACPPDSRLIDARGMTVMPGLIDCHDHLADLEGSMQERAAIPPSLAISRLRGCFMIRCWVAATAI